MTTPANEASAEFSPDGRYIAYASDESGRTEVYVRPFPDVDGDRWQVSSGGGQSPLFSRNGRELFFAVAGSLKRVAIDTAPVFRAGPVETLLEGPFVQGRTDERQYDASSDGRRFLMLKEAAPANHGGDSPRLMVVLGWGDELRRLDMRMVGLPGQILNRSASLSYWKHYGMTSPGRRLERPEGARAAIRRSRRGARPVTVSSNIC